MGIRPELPAGAGVEREHMIEGDRHVHDAVDDDGRRLEALAHVELEDPGRPQIADIVAIDLRVGIVAGLLVIAVGVQEIVAAAGGAIEQVLGDGGHVAVERGSLDLVGPRPRNGERRRAERRQRV